MVNMLWYFYNITMQPLKIMSYYYPAFKKMEVLNEKNKYMKY